MAMALLNEFNPLWIGREVVLGTMELTGGDWLFIGASACALTAAYCCLRSWANGTAAGEGAAARPAGGAGGGDPAAKKRSWLLSLLTSPVLIASGCTSVPGLIRSGFSGSFVTSHSPWHRRSMLFFLSFLVSDLVVGTADYPQEVDVLTGWIHHPVYVYLTLRTLRYRAVCGITPYFIEEIPTLLMALGRLGVYRNDILFGSSYFVLRLVFQAYAIYGMSSSDSLMYRSFLMPMAGALVTHVYWFHAWSMYMLKKRRSADSAARKDATEGDAKKHS